MKDQKKKTNKKQAQRALPEGVLELLAAIGVVALIVVIVICTRSCAYDEPIDPSLTSGIFDDTSAPGKDTPTQTILNPLVPEGEICPINISDNIVLDKIYYASGYFPEDGSDDAIENVLAVKLTNNSDRSLEYLTFTLKVNEEDFRFSVATVPAKKSVYAFNLDRKIAPTKVETAVAEPGFEIYFVEEPSTKSDKLSYNIKNGTIEVTNISGTDILSDIVVYYKATADKGYLGGITYRFRISGGLPAGETFSAYAPHALTHMTEIMFAQYEE